MSVKSSFEMACPKCGDDADLHVTFTGTCRLVGNGSEDCGDHEWDNDSLCLCGECGHELTVDDFRIKDELVLDMGNITDDKTEELLAYVRDIASLPPPLVPPYNAQDYPILASRLKVLINNAREILKVKP